MSNEKVNNAAIDHTFLMTSGKTDELTDSECHDIVILMAKIVTKTIFYDACSKLWNVQNFM
jgi:hypothetical protein